MKKLFLTILLIAGLSYSQEVDTRILYLLENYEFQDIDVDSLSTVFITVSDSAFIDTLTTNYIGTSPDFIFDDGSADLV